MLLSQKDIFLQKRCDECWLMGYRVRQPTHHPHAANCVFQGQQVLTLWSREWLFLSDYDAPFKVHVGKTVSEPDIDSDIPSLQSQVAQAV
jgi:hypothetical protein